MRGRVPTEPAVGAAGRRVAGATRQRDLLSDGVPAPYTRTGHGQTPYSGRQTTEWVVGLTLYVEFITVCMQVSERGLEETEERQYDFNPVNLLAQYLMRNNPRHTHLPPTHPYSKQLQEVTSQITTIILYYITLGKYVCTGFPAVTADVFQRSREEDTTKFSENRVRLTTPTTHYNQFYRAQ